MKQSPYRKADSRSSNLEIPFAYATRMFSTVFATSWHRSLSWASWIQFTPSHDISYELL